MPNDCIYDGNTYSDGSQVCQAGEVCRCDDGSWTNLHFACDEVADEPKIRGLMLLDSQATVQNETGNATTGATVQCPPNTAIETNVMVRGTHGYSLRNTGTQAAQYRVLLRLQDDKGHSFEETRAINLAAGESKRESAGSFFQVAYGASEIGTVRVTATTRISGAVSDAATGTCSFAIFRR